MMTVVAGCEISRMAHLETRQLIPLQTCCPEFRLNKGTWGTTMDLC